MSAKDKAIELVDTYRIMLMNSDTECGEEILCTVIAKQCALIAVDEIYNSGLLVMVDDEQYWYDVKQEIQLL
jgi:hypothetical protein